MVFDAETVIEANSVAHPKFAPQLLEALVGVHPRLTPDMRKMREFHCANLQGSKSKVVELTLGRLTRSNSSVTKSIAHRTKFRMCAYDRTDQERRPTTYKVSPLVARFNDAAKWPDDRSDFDA
jgi:hypothetical protein